MTRFTAHSDKKKRVLDLYWAEMRPTVDPKNAESWAKNPWNLVQKDHKAAWCAQVNAALNHLKPGIFRIFLNYIHTGMNIS